MVTEIETECLTDLGVVRFLSPGGPRFQFACLCCGGLWGYDIPIGGSLPDDWWACPHVGCNVREEHAPDGRKLALTVA